MRTSPAGSAAARRAAGYTLIELLVVLTVLGLIAALAAPMIGRGLNSGLTFAAEEIGTALRAARGRAVAQGRDVALRFDAAAGTVETAPGGAPIRLPEGSEMRLLVAASERDGDTAGRIRFFADGSATGGRVSLRRGETAVEIDVDWFDGRVEVRDAPAR